MSEQTMPEPEFSPAEKIAHEAWLRSLRARLVTLNSTSSRASVRSQRQPGTPNFPDRT